MYVCVNVHMFVYSVDQKGRPGLPTASASWKSTS